MNTNIFGNYSIYYDLLYSDKNYKSEVEYIKNILEDNNKINCDVLEFGSGTGIHGKMLSKIGYNVIGIEKSQSMVDRAEKSERFECFQGDICNVSLNKKFDVILSLFHVMSYQTTNESLNNVFKNANIHLKKDGIFVFDFWYTPAVFNIKPEVKIKNVFNKEISLTRISEPKEYENENLVDVKFTIISRCLKSTKSELIVENHLMRHFSLPEIEIIANYHGFTLLKSEEFLTAKIPTKNTWGVCVVLRKD